VLTLRHRVSDHPAFDQVVAAAAVGVYLTLHYTGVHLVVFPDWASITTFHQTLVEAAAGLFGLVFAAIAILRALGPGRRLNHLQRNLNAPMTRNFKAVIAALGLATFIAIAAMAFDTPAGHPTIARAATAWAVAIVSVRMIRLVWVFGLVLDLSDRDSESGGSSSVTPISTQRRQVGS
jgi:hypothetical protein